uniref:Uncharacterized protein n=1 Tax=Neovison vison TaxID=452646 RepID=A0A8C7AXD4_NEOVI
MCQKWTDRHAACDCCGPTPSCGVRESPNSSLLPLSTQQTHPSLKPGQGTRTVSPEKATESQETAPWPDHSQEISAAQSWSSCSALPTPHPSPEARSGEGRPWLVHFLSHCLPDNGQSST